MVKFFVSCVRDSLNSAWLRIKNMFSQKDGVLVYVGLHQGDGMSKVFQKYEECYGFEANPELYQYCKKRFEKFPRVKIYNYAISDYDGEIEFNISSNRGQSSSIGRFSEGWEDYKLGHIKMNKTIKVACINLYSFFKKNSVTNVKDYISDIQGYDLQVLKTLRLFIENKKIENITCEVIKDSQRCIYKDAPDNSEPGFERLLSENYECVAKGWGRLVDGKFVDVPDDWLEFDCKWKLKSE